VRKLLMVGALVAALFTTGCAEVVDSGHRGVRKSFGEVTDESLVPGLYWYNPIGGDILEIDVRQIAWKGVTPAYTKDVQKADIAFTVNYRLQPDKAHIVYQTVGADWASSQIPQVVYAALKNEAGKWNAVDIISNRAIVQKDVSEAVTKALAPRFIVVERFEITNVDYDSAFEKAVEAKVIAEQEALKAKNQTVTVEEQARQSVIQARAEADSRLLKAEAEAKSIRIRADALTQNPRLVELEAVQKWNGVLPTNMYGSAPVPFINIK